VTRPPHGRSPRDMLLVVDFGTVFTEATLLTLSDRYEVTDPLRGERQWPSCVYAGPDGLAVGAFARDKQESDPLRVIAEFKRKLGTTETFCDGKFAAWELVAELLRVIKAEAQQYVSDPVDRLLITCPGDYKIRVPEDLRWADLDRACRKAGFLDIEYLHEPVAAAYAPVASGPLGQDTVVLVYDFGGGTFDVALARIHPPEHGILAADSMPSCGGADIDSVLAEEIRRLASAGADPGDGLVNAWLKDQAQKTKELLSTTEERTVRRPFAAEASLVTRERLEQLVTEERLIDRTLELVKALLSDSAPVEPDVILTVGGTTRMPLVRKRVEEEFGYPMREPIDIGCAVVDGAEAWARLAGARTSSPDRLALDQVPLRWPVPGGVATVSSWLAESGDPIEAGDTIVRVSLSDGKLWDLKAERPGTLLTQHYRKDQEVRSDDWLATLRPLGPDETDAAILPRLWRMIPGRSLTRAALSNDGRYTATATDNSVTVYDLDQWEELTTFQVASAEQLIFTPAGKLAVVAGRGFGIWDLATLARIKWIDDNRNYPKIAASPDGRFLAVSSPQDRQVKFISADDYKTVRHTVILGNPGYANPCYVSAFSADGSIIVPASDYSGGVTRADWDEGLAIVAGYSVIALAIHPTTNQIFGAESGGYIQIRAKDNFAATPGSAVNAARNIHSMAFNRTGTLLACGLEDGGVEIRRWTGDQVSGPIARFWTGSDCFFTAFMPDGCSLVTANGAGVAIWYLGDTVTPPASRTNP
jgi:WD40 repeat protein